MKKLFQYFIAQRWHLHSIALLINALYFFLGKQYNFMHLGTLTPTERSILSIFLTLFFAVVWEFLQMKKGANKTKLQWLKFAVPDIIFTTLIGYIGHLLVEFNF
jgi:hypothetical protein